MMRCLLLLLVAVVNTNAVDCTRDMAVHTGECLNKGSGWVLASLVSINECNLVLCNQISEWSMAGYAAPGAAYVGDGYIAGCGTKSYSGVPGENICEYIGSGSGSGGGSGKSDGGGDDGLTGGGVFLIIFFVGGFVYFAGGFAYNYKMKELRGAEAVPNVDFWKDLPYKVKDGASFLKTQISEKLANRGA